MKAKKRPTFQKIGLLGRTKMEKHAAFIKKLRLYLKKKNVEIMWDSYISPVLGAKGEHGRAHILKQCDMVISLGGDGTVLKVVRDLPKKKNLFLLPINLGNLGFHTEIQKKSNTFEVMDEFFKGKYHIDERLILRATLYRKGEKIATHLALNDVVINQGNFARLIHLGAKIDQRNMISFKADGVILATPTGSTGHSLSAGGPIIHPRIDAFIFTPICPAELSVRPIVIPSNRQITVRIETERRYKDNQIGLTIDGQIVLPVQYGDEIRVRRSSRKLRFIRKATGGNYYKLLRNKLRWGK